MVFFQLEVYGSLVILLSVNSRDLISDYSRFCERKAVTGLSNSIASFST